MQQITIDKGLDIPISGEPSRTVTDSRPIKHVALVGDDYIGMKPTMLVNVGDRVACGQPLFTDKKNGGVIFTAPGSGEVVAINRGAKRKFESLVIRLEGNEAISFCEPDTDPGDLSSEALQELLVKSGLWCGIRTRPYGKIPRVNSKPASLFVTAIDSSPLGPDMDEIIELHKDDFLRGLKALTKCVQSSVYLCLETGQKTIDESIEAVDSVEFSGPHPVGLPSTHIHFLNPVSETKTAWHIGAQDVIAIGGLFRSGQLSVERIVALAGPVVKDPRHVRTRLGASIAELCEDEISEADVRLLSGSVLDGRQVDQIRGYLGRYHQQISCLEEGDGRQFFGWLRPGGDRFSVTRAFWSSFSKPGKLPLNTAIWGGNRAIFPLGTYEKVMPLDMVPVYLLKSLASGNTERAKELGCLELIEEDLALCSYVCPGKNDFGPMLRETLTSIELEG
jgi:Na+-transporting NADH:ubiquinone oxidoreductase subunit A